MSISNFDIIKFKLLKSYIDIPNFEIGHLETPSTFSANGTKGMGEGGTMAIPAVLANAVADALMEKGRLLNRIPLSEENIFQLLQTG